MNASRSTYWISIVGLAAFVGLACDRPVASRNTVDAEFKVGMPAGLGDDPGSVSHQSVAAPEISISKSDSNGHSLSMSFEEKNASKAAKSSAGLSGPPAVPSPPELSNAASSSLNLDLVSNMVAAKPSETAITPEASNPEASNPEASNPEAKTPVASIQDVSVNLGSDSINATTVGLVQSGEPAAKGNPLAEVIPTPDPDQKNKKDDKPELAEVVPTPPGKKDDGKPVNIATTKTPKANDIVSNLGDSKRSMPPTEEKPESKLDLEDDLDKKPAASEPAIENAEAVDAYKVWPAPAVALVFTGNQHGYIEPCGCTGLDRQKGGVARRFTFLKNLSSTGWPVRSIDAGNHVRRYGTQSEIKFSKTLEALRAMDYVTTGVGPDDLRLGVGPLISATLDGPRFTTANVTIFDDTMTDRIQSFSEGGVTVAMTSLLDPEAIEDVSNVDEAITIKTIEETLPALAKDLVKETADFRVVLYYGDEDKAKLLAAKYEGIDLWVVSGGYGEPTYKPIRVQSATNTSEVATSMIVTGNKGMYAGVIGVYKNQPLRYARIPLTHEFSDAPEMRTLMASYQQELEQIGLQGLGLSGNVQHSSGQEFVGSEKCGSCHKEAMDVWENSMHALATDHIVKPPAERGDIARHFDPECISCHVTGWNPQEYFPYKSGYMSLTSTKHLTGNGCENCHGPGGDHAAAEAKGSDYTDEQKKTLRESMKLPLERARETCVKCHDLDNSPDFHEEDAFEDVYWPQVEHFGKN